MKCPHVVIDKFCLGNLYKYINDFYMVNGKFLVDLLKKLFEEKAENLNWAELVTAQI